MAWRLTFRPTAGYILNIAGGAAPGPLSRDERVMVRDLARQVAEIAAHPSQHRKRDLWYRHVALESSCEQPSLFPLGMLPGVLDD